MFKILVVDDEPGYRGRLQMLLTSEGYEAKTAGNGSDALKAFLPPSPDLLITDWKLRDILDGVGLARALLLNNPRLRTLFITGYSAEQLEDEVSTLVNAQVLEKPFGATVFLNKVRESLDTGPP